MATHSVPPALDASFPLDSRSNATEKQIMDNPVDNYVFKPQSGGTVQLGFGAENATLHNRKGFGFIHEILRHAGTEITYADLIEALQAPAPVVEQDLPTPAMTAEEESSAGSRMAALSDRVDLAKSTGDGKLAESLELERAMIQRQMHQSGRGLPRQMKTVEPSSARGGQRVKTAITAAIEFLRTHEMPLMARHFELQITLGEQAVRYVPAATPIAWSL